MKRRIVITHIESGNFWHSEFENTDQKVKDSFFSEEGSYDNVLILKNGNTNVVIPPKILNESVRTIEYKED